MFIDHCKFYKRNTKHNLILINIKLDKFCTIVYDIRLLHNQSYILLYNQSQL